MNSENVPYMTLFVKGTTKAYRFECRRIRATKGGLAPPCEGHTESTSFRFSRSAPNTKCPVKKRLLHFIDTQYWPWLPKLPSELTFMVAVASGQELHATRKIFARTRLIPDRRQADGTRTNYRVQRAA
jgi:hypothetical protein